MTTIALSTPGNAPGPPPGIVALGVAIAILGFGAVLLWIAANAGEWQPTFLALGCLSMAVAALTHLATSRDFGFVAGSGASGALPSLGMVAGGWWFGIGALPRRLASDAGRIGVEHGKNTRFDRFTRLVEVPLKKQPRGRRAVVLVMRNETGGVSPPFLQ